VDYTVVKLVKGGEKWWIW